MAGEEGSWRTPAFRQSVVSKIDEAIQRSGMPTAKNSVEMENHVFQKAKTKEEYLSFVARLILHVRELNAKKGQGMNGPAGGAGQTMQDPINALQTLARQGTGNAQMIGLGPQAAGMVPQPPTQIPATNLLQTLNQRPGQPLGGLTSLQNKVPDLGLGPGAQTDDTEDEHHNDEDSSQIMEEEDVHPSTSHEKTPEKINKNKKRSADQMERDAQAEEAYNILKKATARDEWSVYGEYIGNELRKLPPTTQTYVKHSFANVLFKAALGEYENHPASAVNVNNSGSNAELQNSGSEVKMNLPSEATNVCEIVNVDKTNIDIPVNTEEV